MRALFHLVAAGLVFATARPLEAQAVTPEQAISAVASPLSPLSGGNAESSSPTLSADGRYVAFVSSANNLVTNDHNGLMLGVFVRDRQTGVTRLVSVNVDGSSSGNGDSYGPSLSADGRLVAFESRARNLVTNETSGLGDIYLRDLGTGVTHLISTNRFGTGGGDRPSTRAALTPAGRFIVFESLADDLAPNDTNGLSDVFVCDLQTGALTLVNLNYQGTASAGQDVGGLEAATSPSISADGRYVAFESTAMDLLSTGGSTNLVRLFVRDSLLQTNILVSVGVDGLPATSDSDSVVISADGRYVAFRSSASNLVCRRDLQTAVTVSLSSPQSIPSSRPVLSTDGRFVAYSDQNQVYVWDGDAGTNVLASANVNGGPGSGVSDTPILSDDGRTLAFLSTADNLVGAQTNTNGKFQMYVRDLTSGVTRLASFSLDGLAGSSADCLFPTLSADGRVVAFTAEDSSLVSDDRNYATDVFVWEVGSRSVELISQHAAGLTSATAGGPSSAGANAVSADGRFAVFSSLASDLTSNDTNGSLDVFVRDLRAGTNILVSANADGSGPGNGQSADPVISANGRYVAFASWATNLVDLGSGITWTNARQEVYVRDLQTGMTTLASLNDAGTQAANGAFGSLSLSADGRYVAFQSTGTDLAAQDHDNKPDVYVRDLVGQTNILASIARSGTGPGGGELPVISPDGRWVLFSSKGGDLLVPVTDTIGRYHFYARDLQNQTTRRISEGYGVSTQALATPLISANSRQTAFVWSDTNIFIHEFASGQTTNVCMSCSKPALSADGRFVAYQAPRPTDQISDVYLKDMVTGVNTLVSVNQTGAGGGNGNSGSPAVSGDGRFVVFRSWASDLVANDTNALGDIFVRDLVAGTTLLVSANALGNGSGNSLSTAPVMAADGSTVVFSSFASDLVEGDLNNAEDVFLLRLNAGGSGSPLLTLTCPGGGKALVFWSVATGKTYRVQYKNDLNARDWSDLPGSVTVNGTQASVTDNTDGATAQRFYRVLVLP